MTEPLWVTALAELIRPFLYVAAPNERLFVLYLATSFVMGVVALRHYRKPASLWKLIQAALPRSVYWHPSARADYVLLVVNNLIEAFFIIPFILTFYFVAKYLNLALLRWVGPGAFLERGPAVVVTLTFIVAIVGDFGLFIVHWMQHKSPFLWEFHKVHHSAAVLTPVTAYRFHPVDTVMNVVATEALQGIVIGFALWAVGDVFPLVMVGGLNVVVFLFYLFGYNLRHSHVWFPYPHWLSRIFISPAQHQIHHSKAPQHFDRNMGFIFAFWDVAFGTLYVPDRREEIEFGLGQDEHLEYPRVRHLYLLPFAKAWRVLTGRRKGESSP